MKRILTYGEAIQEATDLAMKEDPNVFVIGEGVPDPKGIFGTTANLVEKYGPERVMEMPVSENGMTGVCIGASLRGLRPILVHARLDFSILSLDQIINNAAKWYFMFGGQQSVPIVIRMIIGRGWGQGCQHSQNLQAIFAQIPGLKVVMPSSAYDAKGLLAESIKDNNPVIFIEHRWLHYTKSDVPEKKYTVPIGKASVVQEGTDITIVSIGYMTLEARKALQAFERAGVSVELIDVRTLRPLDEDTIINSVKKTGRLLVLDSGWYSGSFSGEVISRISEKVFDSLKTAPQRLTLPDSPTPSTPGLTKYYYPNYHHIIEKAFSILGKSKEELKKTLAGEKERELPWDSPDRSFTGPF